MINFSLPEIGEDQTEEDITAWQELESTWAAASSCAGFMVSLGSELERDGFEQIKKIFIPKVQELLQGVLPRVITGYATLMWFTSKVSKKMYSYLFNQLSRTSCGCF